MKKLLSALLLISCLAVPVHADAKTHHAAKAQKDQTPPLPDIVLTYDVFVGGIHLLTADVLFGEHDGTYRSRVHAYTQGMWHRMLPWDNNIDVHGGFKYGKFTPVEYTSRDEWDHKPKTTMLRFDKRGDIAATFDPPSGPENRELVSKQQRIGALDPATALLQMLGYIAMNGSCGTVVHVFDGKRRFDVTGVDKGTEYVDEADYGIFKGEAKVCSAEFTMIAGEWKDRKPSKFWQKSETENGRDPFHVYLAPVGPNAIDLAFRMESTSMFGLIIGHLTSWHYASAAEIKG